MILLFIFVLINIPDMKQIEPSPQRFLDTRILDSTSSVSSPWKFARLARRRDSARAPLQTGQALRP